jgi:hypothetical protein
MSICDTVLPIGLQIFTQQGPARHGGAVVARFTATCEVFQAQSLPPLFHFASIGTTVVADGPRPLLSTVPLLNQVAGPQDSCGLPPLFHFASIGTTVVADGPRPLLSTVPLLNQVAGLQDSCGLQVGLQGNQAAHPRPTTGLHSYIGSAFRRQLGRLCSRAKHAACLCKCVVCCGVLCLACLQRHLGQAGQRVATRERRTRHVAATAPAAGRGLRPQTPGSAEDRPR